MGLTRRAGESERAQQRRGEVDRRRARGRGGGLAGLLLGDGTARRLAEIVPAVVTTAAGEQQRAEATTTSVNGPAALRHASTVPRLATTDPDPPDGSVA